MNLPALHAVLPALTEAFDFVLRASLLAAVAILMVVSIRWTLGSRLAPAARGWLWFPVVLLCLSPRLPSFIGWNVSPEGIAKPVREVFEPALGPIVVRGEPQLLKDAGMPAPQVVRATMSIREALAIAWGAGSVCLGAFWLIAYVGLWRRVRREQGAVSERLREEFRDCVLKAGLRRVPRLLVTGAVDNPAVAGLWRPTVLVPPGLLESMDRSSLRHVLLHELGHIRRMDLWLHWASALMVVLHWFNPLVWLAARKFRVDREAACDAAVIHAIDGQAHAYGETLLALGSRAVPSFAPRLMAGMLGGADMVKQRIVDITRRDRNSRMAACFAFVVVLSGAGMLAVVAAEPAPPTTIAETKPAAEKDAASPSFKTAAKELYTRTFRVPPDFLTWIQEQGPQDNPARGEEKKPKPTAVVLLKQLGVPFPEGASATFVPSTSQLIARNTADNLDLIEAIIDARQTATIRQIYVTSHVVVFKEGSKPNLLGPMQPAPEKSETAAEPISGTPAPPLVVHPAAGNPAPFAVSGVFTDPQFQVLFRALMGKGVPAPDGKPDDTSYDAWLKTLAGQVQTVVRMPSVVTRNGQKATVEVVREFIFPTAYDPVQGATKDTHPKLVPTHFEMKPVGFLLDVEPVIGADGYTLDLVLAPQMPSFIGWTEYPVADGEKIKNPAFESRKVSTSVTIWDGQTVAFSGESSVSPFLLDPSLKGEAATLSKVHPVMIFVTAAMIDPSGNPVGKPVQKGEKNDTPEKAPDPQAKGGKAATAGGVTSKRARLQFHVPKPGTRELDREPTAAFTESQLAILLGKELRTRAVKRVAMLYPNIAPVPVDLGIARLPESGQVIVEASGTSEAYVRYFLDGLLDELMAVRKEAMEKIAYGALGKILQEVLASQKEVKTLTEHRDHMAKGGAPKEEIDKINAELERETENLRVWTQKLQQAEEAHGVTSSIDILERPAPAKENQ
ncbi:beta-lactamase regulating signal transducer with metallopeptidase domain [Roseimicrobium gellanilyticum]|uniref:Beta-lactamase regulating signal transducer with metallopeptidase domain n=1 Tax=Roseimicrobium gellanilyticum TaxID=748857 RepID=A0A366HA46_9BACT|nr:M56 family metallopeptidase [Roseimicrobium gellanilyticum]RBP39140.1 beta-lactamase regulating signal transducer with metallopeptidase domain [Roseimicrobium gellanilyticum]